MQVNFNKIFSYDKYVYDYEELSLLGRLDPKYTKLCSDLLIDESEIYKIFEHPLWLYFRNSYEEHSLNWLPIYVSKTPYLVYSDMQVNISKEDLNNIFRFIRNHVEELIDVANRKLDILKFIKLIENK